MWSLKKIKWQKEKQVQGKYYWDRARDSGESVVL